MHLLDFLPHIKFPHFRLTAAATVCQLCGAITMKQRKGVYLRIHFPFFLSVCQILPKGVVSVIGPASSPASGSTVSHICGEKEVSEEDKNTQNAQICLYVMCASGAVFSLTYYPSYPHSRHDGCI